MKHVAIVMAAGSGSRMGSDIPKQYLSIKGRPVLYFSLKAFEDSFVDEIIIVTRAEDVSYCRAKIVDRFGIKKVVGIVPGGKERSDSVFEGLKAVKPDEETYVYIHDGARPCITEDILDRAKEDVQIYGATVVGVPSKDTVKLADENGNVDTTPERKKVWSVQTPQAFKYEVIYNAFLKMQEAGDASVTDDGMVVERYSGVKVHLTMGDYRNIKITTPEDLKVVENFLLNI